MNKITLTGTLVKSSDLPDEIVKGVGDSDHLFYASVEVPDIEGDIIRIKGMKVHDGVKFCVNHKLKANEDGTLPVIGKTMGWRATTHKALGVPAMVVGVKFAPTKLGKEFKSLYDDGFLTDVSIQAQPTKGRPIRGGLDVEECEVIELSACIKGVNQYASIIKSLDLGDPAPEPVSDKITAAVLKSLSPLCERFESLADDIECALKSGGKAQDTEQPAAPKAPSAPQPDWSAALEALDSIKSLIPTSN